MVAKIDGSAVSGCRSGSQQEEVRALEVVRSVRGASVAAPPVDIGGPSDRDASTALPGHLTSIVAFARVLRPVERQPRRSFCGGGHPRCPCLQRTKTSELRYCPARASKACSISKAQGTGSLRRSRASRINLKLRAVVSGSQLSRTAANAFPAAALASS
jgi:hypothetical protein